MQEKAKMTIAIDGFGGDNAPLSVLQGCEMAVKELDVHMIVTGDEQKLKACASENNISLEGITIHHTEDVIAVEDHPQSIMKEHNNCSMAEALKLVANGDADAFVTAGSTGAMVIGSTFIVKRIKGIKRAALAPIIPTAKGPYMLMDSGANIECKSEALVHFAIMGSIYMNKIMGIESPRVGLVNIGAEETKGPEVLVETNKILRESSLNFIGNIEPRQIPFGDCDVAIADGFTGNVILKLTEGLGKMLADKIKGMFMTSTLGKVAGLLVFGKIREFKKSMDYKEAGGAPLMGVSKPVIKAHGSSDGRAFKNAIRQARDFAQRDVIGTITHALAEQKAIEQAEE